MERACYHRRIICVFRCVDVGEALEVESSVDEDISRRHRPNLSSVSSSFSERVILHLTNPLQSFGYVDPKIGEMLDVSRVFKGTAVADPLSGSFPIVGQSPQSVSRRVQIAEF